MAEEQIRVVGIKFLLLHRLYKQPDYNYSKIKLDNYFLKQNFVKIVTTHLDHNLKVASYWARSGSRKGPIKKGLSIVPSFCPVQAFSLNCIINFF